MSFFLKKLESNFYEYPDCTAYVIAGESYTYSYLSERIAAIQLFLENYDSLQYFGVVTRNSIDTYAAIFALWFSGKTMVPLRALNPVERNVHIVHSVGIECVFDAKDDGMLFDGASTICTKSFRSGSRPKRVNVSGETDCYVLFTSGSTGFPKGVRITRNNLDFYLQTIDKLNYQLTRNDRCLQVYDLTFDGAVQSYVFPLLYGAAIYTIDQSDIKYRAIIKSVVEYEITFLKMTPSVLYFLQPYFNKMVFPLVRWSLFGGEALTAEMAEKWQQCVPNATIQNVYGPTEATVNCSLYTWGKNGENKQRNGIVSIGKIYEGTLALVCDQNLNEVGPNMQGELCIAGSQLTKGYWNNVNEHVFFEKQIEGKNIRFYRTGDIVIKDADDDLFFISRTDSQVQINGYRVEPGELEFNATNYTKKRCIVLVNGNVETGFSLFLFVEGSHNCIIGLNEWLKSKLPEYMLPSKIIVVDTIPLLPSGKADRMQLIKLIEQ